MKKFLDIRVGCVLFPLAILAAFYYIFFFALRSATRAPVTRVIADMRSLGNALEAYYVDNNNSYPACSVDPDRNAFGDLEKQNPILALQPTFMIPNGTNPATLTTPVAYIIGYPRNPKQFGVEAPFSYYSCVSKSSGKAGWILWNPGPDKIYELSIDNITKIYNPDTTETLPYLIERTYDSSNGTFSRGDIWRKCD
jgi:hypothetical protein